MEIKNPFTWIEIYVDDMDRAQKFYETVLQVKLQPMPSPIEGSGWEMLCFPWSQNGPNISGALCKMAEMKPGFGGTLAYFDCEDCAIESGRVTEAGGKVFQQKFQIGEHGFCSIAMDTEGNMIGFHSMK